MTRLTTMLFVLMLAQPVWSQDTPSKTEFRSKSARKAVDKFNKEVSRLNKVLLEHIEKARDELEVDLKASLKNATEINDLAEVQRISSFLNSEDFLAASPSADQSRVSTARKIRKLKSQLQDAQKDLVTILVQEFQGKRRTIHVLGSDGTIRSNNKPSWWKLEGSDLILSFDNGRWMDRCQFTNSGARFQGLNKEGKAVQGAVLLDGLGLTKATR